MKTVLFICTLFVAAVVEAAPSAAYNDGAWCAKSDIGAGNVRERCDFPDFETCRRYILGENTSFCVQNPYYVPARPANTEPAPRPAKR